MRYRTFVILSFAAALMTWGGGSALAEVAQLTPNGFLVRYEKTIEAPPAMVWTALVDQVGAWWHPDHTWSGRSANLSIDARPGGCFCEQLPNGGVEHLRVVYVEAEERLRLSGALGPLQASGLAGSMMFELGRENGETKLIFTYSVGGFVEVGFDALAPIVDRVLGEQLTRLVAFVETGNPVPASTAAPPEE